MYWHMSEVAEVTACGNQQQEGKKRRKKKTAAGEKHIVGLFMRPLLSQQIRRHTFRCKKIHVNLWFPHRPGGTYALCLGVFVCLFKGTVHSKLKFHPCTPERCVNGGSGGIPHNRSGFSRWERIALNGHLLWPSKKKTRQMEILHMLR